jgi:RNA polymerase sigma factor (sigma-70 family)
MIGGSSLATGRDASHDNCSMCRPFTAHSPLSTAAGATGARPGVRHRHPHPNVTHVTPQGKPDGGGSRLEGVRSLRGTPTEPDEERLVRLVARGDRAAFEELYRRTAPWLAVRLHRRCSDEQIVAEVMQETYLAVWRAAGAFAGSSIGGTAVGWLWTIAARRLVDAFRRRAHHAVPPAVASAEAAAPAAEDVVLAATVGGEVGDALKQLAPELRDVLQAMVLDGLSVRETSVLLGLPEGTVKTRARRARSAMREALSS